MNYIFYFFLIYFISSISIAYTENDLISAAQDCDSSLIGKILQKGDINIDVDIWGKTPLMIAAGCESPESARVLVEKGAQLNLMSWATSNQPPKSAIMYAVDCENCLDTLSYLISVGSDLNLSSRYTALTWAMSLERIPQATLLIKSGADVNIGSQWEHERTPLMFAVDLKNVALAKLIIARGANINFQEENQRLTALHYALNNPWGPPEKDEIASYLIQKSANLNLEDVEGNTPLFWSSNKGRTLFYELVQKGADIHHKNKKGQSILMVNTRVSSLWNSDDLNLYRWILDQGVNPDLQDYKFGESALMTAAWIGNIEALEVLISKNANLNLKNLVGKTALTLCKESTYISNETLRNKIVDLLIKNGATE